MFTTTNDNHPAAHFHNNQGELVAEMIKHLVKPYTLYCSISTVTAKDKF